MTQQIMLELPEEVLLPLREQASYSGRTLDEEAIEWLRGIAQLWNDRLYPGLMAEARSKYDRLPAEIRREIPDALPEGLSTPELAKRIETFDLILNTAALNDEERDLLNRSLDDILAAMARLSAEIQSAKEATLRERRNTQRKSPSDAATVCDGCTPAGRDRKRVPRAQNHSNRAGNKTGRADFRHPGTIGPSGSVPGGG